MLASLGEDAEATRASIAPSPAIQRKRQTAGGAGVCIASEDAVVLCTGGHGQEAGFDDVGTTSASGLPSAN